MEHRVITPDARPYNPFEGHRTCSGCQHYSAPGTWSARCKLVDWDWKQSHDWNVAVGIRRAGQTCADWAEANGRVG